MDKTIELITPSLVKVNLPAVLTIAGSDSSGGAGIEADLKTFTAHGVYGLTCITALTAQNTMGVKKVEKTPKEQLRAILDVNFEDFVENYENSHPLKVVKTGMLTDDAAEALSTRIDYFNSHNIKLVMDPVMVSTSGRKLVDEQTMQMCLATILPNAFLCTPNFVEAEHLWQASGGGSLEVELVAQLKKFVVELQKRLRCENLLVKGGHIPWLDGKRFQGDSVHETGLEIVDVLYQSATGVTTTFLSPYINATNTHGTGCTLASAISANLAKGLNVEQAVTLAVHFVHLGMVSAEKLGHGTGPLNHTVRASESVRDVVRGRKYHSEIKEKHGLLLLFFKNHEKIRDNWRKYTEHPFVLLLATNQLPFDQFLYFLKQDFYYLVNYAQIHGLAASVAPNCEQIQAQAAIIGNIMTEIDRHKEKLLEKFQIDYDNSDLDKELQPSKACLDYCNYLLNIGRNEDFLGIKVALAPCLHGYAEAGEFGTEIRKRLTLSDFKIPSEQADIYSSWLADYTSKWYTDASAEGERTLDLIFAQKDISDQRMAELVSIFNDVVHLEIAFWDEVLSKW